MVPRHVVVLLGLLGLVSSAAHAEEPASGAQFARGVADRARRAISIGPMVGAGFAYAPSTEHLDVPVTFGLGLVLFDIPVAPGPRAIEEMVKTRVKAKVTAAITSGAPAPDPQALARLAAEVLAEVKAEVLGQRPYTGRTLERPRLSLALEGAYQPRASAWQVRATFGYGISRVTIGPTIARNFAGANGLYLGGELAAHLTPRPGPRSHVVDVFLRADFGVTSNADGAHQVGAGLRLLLDLI